MPKGTATLDPKILIELRDVLQDHIQGANLLAVRGMNHADARPTIFAWVAMAVVVGSSALGDGVYPVLPEFFGQVRVLMGQSTIKEEQQMEVDAT